MKRLIVGVCMLAMTACASLSFDQRLAAAYTMNTGARAGCAAALDAGQLESDQGIHCLALTDRTRTILDESADGDERGLTMAIEIMQALEDSIE